MKTKKLQRKKLQNSIIDKFKYEILSIKTPFYIYDISKIINNYLEYEKSFKKYLKNKNFLICYAIKANSNINILKTLVSELDGRIGADIVSGGELYRCLNSGINKIVFSGVGKTDDEIEYAIRNKVTLIQVESLGELLRINEIAKKIKVLEKVKISIRVNPNLKIDTHRHLATGDSDSKFGFSICKYKNSFVSEFEEGVHALNNLEHVKLSGISFHIGSQILKNGQWKEAINNIKKIIPNDLEYFSVGGGLGIKYSLTDFKSKISIDSFVKEVCEYTKNIGKTLIIEPGRSLVGDSGYLVTKVLYVKPRIKKHIAVLDAGMNDFMRPAMYGAFHPYEILNLQKNNDKIKEPLSYDIVGPLCECSDSFYEKEKILNLNVGDLFVIKNVGAYGYSMSSNYNSRPKIDEYMIYKNKIINIRRRETYLEMVKNELN